MVRFRGGVVWTGFDKGIFLFEPQFVEMLPSKEMIVLGILPKVLDKVLITYCFW